MEPEVPVSDLSQDVKRLIFSTLDMNLNTEILQTFMHGKSVSASEVALLNIHFLGLYTGIVAVTLWTICM